MRDSMPEGSRRQLAAEDKLQILVEASATLLGSSRVEDLLPFVLELARELNAAEACAIWRLDSATSSWRIFASQGLSDEYKRGSLAERVALVGQPFVFEDVNEEAAVADRRSLYESEGIRSLISFPIQIDDKPPGMLAYYYRRRHRFSEVDLRVASALTNLAASAIRMAELYGEQERNRVEAVRARVRAAFLAEASAVLASSLDCDATLAGVARLAVRHIADWCVVDMLQENGALKPVAMAHADPARVEWASQLHRQFPTELRSSLDVVRTGKPELRPDIPDDLSINGACDARFLELVRSAGLKSYMCVPLTVRNRVLGAITFVSAVPDRRYGGDDLALAEDLARRVAIAADNALLYFRAERERAALEVALTALRENEERLRMALEAGRMGIWDWDIAADALKWSESLLAIHGFGAGEFDGTYQAFARVIHPDDRSGFEATLERALKEKTHLEAEFRVVHRDGSLHWVAGKGMAYYGDDGQPARMIGLGMDVTERRLLEEKLRKAQKMESIGLLAGGIAHDFNNLLTGILGNVSLALEVMPKSHPAAPLVENALRASERAADLTRQLLAYSGKGKFVIEKLDLSAQVREIASLIHATIPKLVRLTLDLRADLPPIEADSSQIQQVIMNLMINAAEAIGDREGTVLVSTGLEIADEQYVSEHFAPDELRPGSYVYLEVHDTGCGMDRETQAKLFDPFFTTKFTGRGLGLSAVSGIVRGHRGAIQVFSVPGAGSTFRVLFPAVAGSAAPEARTETGADLCGSGLVLLIDDEEPVRTTAEAALRRYGYHAAVARDGVEGVEVFRRSPGEFVAVLLDLTMPVLGGQGTLRLIRQVRPDVPVIGSSGYNETEASRQFPAGELAGFLQKPYTSAALARKLREVLALPRAQKRSSSQSA
jgi:PAS domain S-box-containing protein